MAKPIKSLLGLAIIGALAAGTSAPAEASIKKFNSCSSLNSKFKGGVSRHPQLVFDSIALRFQPKYNDKIYKSHKKLDFDRDGIVCEVTAATWAHKQMLSRLEKSPKLDKSLLVIRSGPSVTKESLASVEKSALTAMKLFSKTFPLEPVNATWFTSDDINWVDSAVAEAGAFPKNYSNNLRNFLHQCNVGNAGIGDKGPYLNQCLGPSGAPANHYPETAAHEYFHTLQFGHMGGQSLPFWFMEGAATFVGIHVGGHSFGDFENARNITLGRYAYRALDRIAKEAISKSDLSSVVSRLVALENPNPDNTIRESAYVFGMLLTEKLVSDYGFARWEVLLSSLAASGFERAFSETYKLSIQEYYLEVAPYIISQLKLSNFGF